MTSPDALVPHGQMLLVSDWAADPDDVADAAARAFAPAGDCDIAVVVPAWLHGIDWIGDPMASVPCASRHEQLLTAACRARGLTVREAAVGDPHPVTAVLDACSSRHYERILVAREPRRIGWPAWLRVERRIQRASGIPVETIGLSRPKPHRAHHCVAEPGLAV